MIFDDIPALALILGLMITLGGCYCCQVCAYCDDATSTLAFDVITNADQCNGSGCDNLTGTYVLDMDDTCCVSYTGDLQPCTTDDCEGCGLTPAGLGLVCCESGGACEDYAVIQLGSADCTPDAAFNSCITTAGCGGDATPSINDTACASDAACAGYFGEEDPGYSCERTVNCDPNCACSSVALAISACIQDDGTKIRLVGSVGDGQRSFEFNEELGDLPTINCLDAIEELALTLNEIPNGGASQLCTFVSVKVTGAEG